MTAAAKDSRERTRGPAGAESTAAGGGRVLCLPWSPSRAAASRSRSAATRCSRAAPCSSSAALSSAASRGPRRASPRPRSSSAASSRSSSGMPAASCSARPASRPGHRPLSAPPRGRRPGGPRPPRGPRRRRRAAPRARRPAPTWPSSAAHSPSHARTASRACCVVALAGQLPLQRLELAAGTGELVVRRGQRLLHARAVPAPARDALSPRRGRRRRRLRPAAPAPGARWTRTPGTARRRRDLRPAPRPGRRATTPPPRVLLLPRAHLGLRGRLRLGGRRVTRALRARARRRPPRAPRKRRELRGLLAPLPGGLEAGPGRVGSGERARLPPPAPPRR